MTVSLADLTYEQGLELLYLRKQALDAGKATRVSREERADSHALTKIGNDWMEKRSEGGWMDNLKKQWGNFTDSVSKGWNNFTQGTKDQGQTFGKWWNDPAQNSLRNTVYSAGAGAGLGALTGGITAEKKKHRWRNALMGGLAGGALGGGAGLLLNADDFSKQVGEMAPKGGAGGGRAGGGGRSSVPTSTQTADSIFKRYGAPVDEAGNIVRNSDEFKQWVSQMKADENTDMAAEFAKLDSKSLPGIFGGNSGTAGLLPYAPGAALAGGSGYAGYRGSKALLGGEVLDPEALATRLRAGLESTGGRGNVPKVAPGKLWELLNPGGVSPVDSSSPAWAQENLRRTYTGMSDADLAKLLKQKGIKPSMLTGNADDILPKIRTLLGGGGDDVMKEIMRRRSFRAPGGGLRGAALAALLGGATYFGGKGLQSMGNTVYDQWRNSNILGQYENLFGN